METKFYDMAEDVKLLMPAMATILDKMDEVHKAMPVKEDLTHGLSAVKAEDDDDALIAPTTHEDLPSTSALQDIGDEEEDDEEDDEDEEPQIPDVIQDLRDNNDDDDNDDDDLTIQYHPRLAQKGVSLREPAS
ncbi:calsequestrin-1-like [Cynara cardunculus var. scolymus]|uniref:calsequestrin-1-like n=1 Tax=Cynara cardunculus var. scolymus TaxID=59895 RepID=UPI000D62BF96|nr:calsequestrin-1-like [Cynara cardunculus var. scolymus]